MPEPYYADDLVTLYHGRCEDMLPTLPAVDLIVTSPPYNLGASPSADFGHYKRGQDTAGGARKWGGVGRAGISYGAHNDAMDPAEYERWQRSVLTACWEGLTDRGAIYYVHKPRVQADTLWTPLTLNPGLPVRQILFWARSGGVNFGTTHYLPTTEWIIIFAKSGFRLRDRGASGVGDIWRIPQRPSEHPAPFPVGIPARAIETTVPRAVLDPFAGSGTTLVAAKAAGIPAIGIEIEERHCELAATRLSQGVLDFTEAS